MDALCREVAQRLLVDFNLVVAVGASVFDGLDDRQAFYHAPAQTVAFDVLSQVADFLARPYLAQGYVVQGRDDAFYSNLFQHGKRNLIVLAKPSPCSFHL